MDRKFKRSLYYFKSEVWNRLFKFTCSCSPTSINAGKIGSIGIFPNFFRLRLRRLRQIHFEHPLTNDNFTCTVCKASWKYLCYLSVRIHNSFLVTRAMVLKKIDNRIRVLIENGVQKRHRSLFVVVGDKGKDQVSYEINFFLLLGLTVFAKQ